MRLFFFLNIWIYENKDGGRCIPGSADKEQNYWSQTTGKYTLIYKHIYKRKLKIDQQETRSFSPVVGVYITMKTTFYLSFDFQQTIFKLHVYNSKQKAAVNWQLLLVSCYICIQLESLQVQIKDLNRKSSALYWNIRLWMCAKFFLCKTLIGIKVILNQGRIQEGGKELIACNGAP